MKLRLPPDLSNWDQGFPDFEEERRAFVSGLRAGILIATMLTGIAGLVFAAKGAF